MFDVQVVYSFSYMERLADMVLGTRSMLARARQIYPLVVYVMPATCMSVGLLTSSSSRPGNT